MSIFESIIKIFENPSTNGPNFRFNNGQVIDGIEQYQDSIPNLSGTFNDDWDVTQWCSGSYFDPISPVLEDVEFKDNILGTPVATWQQGSINDSAGNSSLSIYDSSESSDASEDGRILPGYTYGIQVQGGKLNDVNLQTYKNLSTDVTFNHQINFTANERITNVSGSTGLVSFGNNFTVNFNTVKKISGVPQLGIFLQSVVYDSRGVETVEAGYSSLNGSNSGGKIYSPGDLTAISLYLGSMEYNYNGELDAFSGDTSSFHNVSINLNAALDKIITILSSQDPQNASYYQDLSNWNLTGSYVGGEAGNLGTAQPSNSSATMDINNISITQDLSSNIKYSNTSQKIQSISDLPIEDNQISTTTPSDGETNLILNSGSEYSSIYTLKNPQDITSNGNDTLTIDSGTAASVHALGLYTNIIGKGGSATIDGNSVLNVSGSFSYFTSENINSNSVYNISINTDMNPSIKYGTVNFSLEAASTLTLSTGSNAKYNITQNNDSKSILLTGNNSVEVNNESQGYQVIVSGNISSTGKLLVNGGGNQQVWTGSQDTVFNASDASSFSGGIFSSNKGNVNSAYIDVQGGTTNVNLNTEMVTVWSNSGITNVYGSLSSSANDLLVSQGGDMNITGGAGTETLVAFANETNPEDVASVEMTAGSGSQTIFNYGVDLTVNGGDNNKSNQLIISSNSKQIQSVNCINGGSGYQEIWSTSSNTFINASTSTASGSIKDVVQGGDTTFNSGIENAQVFVFGGSLNANLGYNNSITPTGNVSIQGDIKSNFNMALNDFTSSNDTLILTGLSDTHGYKITEKGNSTVLTFDNSKSSVMIGGVTNVDIHNIGDSAIQIYVPVSS